jgi:hypothetical protein
MITRNLSRRSERLETRLMPAGEPLVIEVQFVSSDGSVADRPPESVRQVLVFAIMKTWTQIRREELGVNEETYCA